MKRSNRSYSVSNLAADRHVGSVMRPDTLLIGTSRGELHSRCCQRMQPTSLTQRCDGTDASLRPVDEPAATRGTGEATTVPSAARCFLPSESMLVAGTWLGTIASGRFALVGQCVRDTAQEDFRHRAVQSVADDDEVSFLIICKAQDLRRGMTVTREDPIVDSRGRQGSGEFLREAVEKVKLFTVGLTQRIAGDGGGTRLGSAASPHGRR